MQYWDTSTLAKLYVSESDSAQFAAYLAATGPVTTSELARWELFRVLARKEAESMLPTGAAEDSEFLASRCRMADPWACPATWA